MADLLKVTGGVKTQGNLPEAWTAPASLFDTVDRNDSSVYGWNAATSTLTLPSSDLADGYLVIGAFEYHDTSNGRFNPQGKFVQASGSGDFVGGPSAGYSRDTSEDRAYVRAWAFINNPSASATIQFQWKADADDSTGGTERSALEVIPIYYSDIGMYTSADHTLMGGTTPNVVPGWATTLEGTNITRSGNVVTVAGDNKRYLILNSQFFEGRGGRTQRWHGLDIDGSEEHAAKAYSYYRNTSNDENGDIFTHLLETATANVTIEQTCYRGIGVSAGQGGADSDGSDPGVGDHAMVVIELNDSAEVFFSKNSAKSGDLNVTGPVDLSLFPTTNFNNDSDSFTRVSDSAVNAEVAMDALLGANLSAAQEVVSTTSRWTAQGRFTVDGVEDDDTFSGDYGRNNQGTIDTFGWSANLLGAVALAQDEDIGVSIQELAGGEDGGQFEIQVGWGGMWGINLDTLEDTGGAQALTLPAIASTETMYTPTVAAGSVDLTLPHITNANTLYGMEITQYFFEDFFTESSNTTLASHTPDKGTSWTRIINNSSDLAITASTDTVDAAAATGGLGDGAFYTADVTYPSADYKVEIDMTVGDTGDDSHTLGVRVQDASNAYYVMFNEDYITLFKIVSGTVTELDDGTPPTISNGDTVRLEAVGSDIKVYINDVETLSAVDTSITAAGKGGYGQGETFDATRGEDLSAQEADHFRITDLGDGTLTLILPHIASAETIYTPTIDTGAVTLTLPHIGSSEATYAMTVDAGAVTLEPPHIASTAALYAMSLDVGAVTLQLPLIASVATLSEPTVSVGDVELTLPLISSTDALYTMTLDVGAVTLQLPQIASTETIYEPSIDTGAVTLELPQIGSTETLYAPEIDQTTTLYLPQIASTEALYGMTIDTGAVTLTLPLIGSAETIYTPQVSTGAVEVLPPHISSTSTLYAMTVDVGAATVELPQIASAEVLYGMTVDAGSATLVLPLIASSSVVYDPSLDTSVDLTLPLIASSDALYGMTIETGSVTVELPLINNTPVLYGMTLVQTEAVGLPVITNTSTLYGFTLLQDPFLELPRIENQVQFYDFVSNVGITLPSISDTHIYPPEVSPFDLLQLPAIVMGSNVYPMTLLNLAPTLELPHISESEIFALHLVRPAAAQYTGASWKRM